jgi:hypothetical protein
MLGHVSDEENHDLILIFTEKQMEQVLASMKVDTVLGPDGLPVIFFNYD